jgi:cysteine-rich repeat protein
MYVRTAVRLVAIALASVCIVCAAATPARASWYTFHRLISNGSQYFGNAMAAVDDRFLVGDPEDGTNGPNTGAVHLIDARSGDTLLTIPHPDPQPYSDFGLTVAFSGNDLVVGAEQQSVDGEGSIGAVYVFDGTTGALRFTLANPMPSAGDRFGCSVAVSGNDILVGAVYEGTPYVPYFLPPGAAYLFDATTGALRLTLAPPSPLGMSFGFSVGFVDGNPLVGAVNDSTITFYAGGAYLFDDATGALLHHLHAPIPEYSSGFGARVGAIAGRPVVAAVFDDLVKTDAGAIYLFDQNGSAMGAFPNPMPDNVEPHGIGKVTFDAIDDRLLAASFFHYTDGSTPGGDSIYVIDTETGAVLQKLVGPDPFGTEIYATNVIASNERIVVSSIGQVFVFDPVGNHFIATQEQCDDGNTVDGDGCSARGLRETPHCPAAPRADCNMATSPRGARLTLRDRTDHRRDTLALHLRSASGADQLGDPTVADGYLLCLYDTSSGPQPRRALTLPSNAACAGGACWRRRGGGFTYHDRAETSDGIAVVRLQRSSQGGVTVSMTGRGANLQPPGSLGVPVQAQLLRTDGAGCWSATFSAAAESGAAAFDGRSD